MCGAAGPAQGLRRAHLAGGDLPGLTAAGIVPVLWAEAEHLVLFPGTAALSALEAQITAHADRLPPPCRDRTGEWRAAGSVTLLTRDVQSAMPDVWIGEMARQQAPNLRVNAVIGAGDPLPALHWLLGAVAVTGQVLRLRPIRKDPPIGATCAAL